MAIFFCFSIAWGMVFGACWMLASHWKTGFIYVRRLHQVPCCKCEYFTNSCYLKCTVNPHLACTEESIDCRDYRPRSIDSPKLTPYL